MCHLIGMLVWLCFNDNFMVHDCILTYVAMVFDAFFSYPFCAKPRLKRHDWLVDRLTVVKLLLLASQIKEAELSSERV